MGVMRIIDSGVEMKSQNNQRKGGKLTSEEEGSRPSITGTSRPANDKPLGKNEKWFRLMRSKYKKQLAKGEIKEAPLGFGLRTYEDGFKSGFFYGQIEGYEQGKRDIIDKLKEYTDTLEAGFCLVDPFKLRAKLEELSK